MGKDREKAQESRDKLGYLGNSLSVKFNKSCQNCGHVQERCSNKYSNEDALQALTKDIPEILREFAARFACYQPFMKMLDLSAGQGLKKARELLKFTPDDPSSLFWNVQICVTSYFDAPVENVSTAQLNILYPGNTLLIGSYPMSSEKKEEIENLLRKKKVIPEDVIFLRAELMDLTYPKYSSAPHRRTDWESRTKDELKALICEETGLTLKHFEAILDYADKARITAQKKDNFQKGLQKAIKGLEDSKSFTKSPQLKELREELEETLNYRIPQELVFGY